MRFFHTFIGSFYSIDTYREVRRSQGHGLAYSFLLVTLTTFVGMAIALFFLHRALFLPIFGPKPIFDDVILQIADQLPVMTLKDNHLVTQEPKPTNINVDVTVNGKHYRGIAATIDTTGTTTYETMKTPVLITGKDVVMKGKTETKIRSFTELNNGHNPTIVFNKAVSHDMAEQLNAFVHAHIITFYLVMAVFLSISIIFVFYLLRLCMLLALAVGGILIGQCLKTTVTFQTAMRMAAVSYTPVFFIQILCSVFMGGRTAGALWLFMAGLVMLGVTLRLTRDAELADVAQSS